MRLWNSSILSRFTYGRVRIFQSTENKINDDVNNSEKKSHWIKGVNICAYISSAVLLINVVFLIVAATLASKNRDVVDLTGFRVIYDGSCTLSKRWDLVLHLIINILSTTILAASNYTMQALVAPSREEVDKRHKQGKWLDVGTPSIRNLFVVGRYRAFLWFVLLVTATPFHLLYNSAISGLMATNDYSVIVIPGDLDPAETLNYTTPGLESCFSVTGMSWDEFATRMFNGSYTRVDAEKCNDVFSTTYPSGLKSVARFSDELTVRNDGDLSFLYNWNRYDEEDGESIWGAVQFSRPSYAFTLPTDDGTVVYTTDNFTRSDCMSKSVTGNETACSDAEQLEHWLALAWEPSQEEINDYINTSLTSSISARFFNRSCGLHGPSKTFPRNSECLLFETEERCKLSFSLPIFLAIISAAAVKVMAMFLAARLDRSRTAPLLTIGDAVASFLTRPDETTKGRCWTGRSDVREGTWASASSPRRGYLSRRGRWIQAGTVSRWLMTLSLCGVSIGVGIFLLLQAAGKWWVEGGFGRYAKGAYLAIVVDSFIALPHLNAVLIANTPHFVVTISYYFYNNIMTNMLAASEYDSYGIERKGLRVSWPQKNTSQRSTYWLSIPYRYSIPILMAYMTLHWAISQSLFIVQIVQYGIDGELMWGSGRLLAYSPAAILLSVLLGGLMVLALLTLALARKFRSMMPLAGSCSVAISAACHPGSGEDAATVALKKVKWGETMTFPEGMMDIGELEGAGHCSFTSMAVFAPSGEKIYA
ncbi:hypothetical protein BJX61DRAFT_545098 [Aspergillus egyptiacus]|nr:hypothetical protein BJX61DRAFT_545098 [Aspergillus egyptiacus]